MREGRLRSRHFVRHPRCENELVRLVVRPLRARASEDRPGARDLGPGDRRAWIHPATGMCAEADTTRPSSGCRDCVLPAVSKAQIVCPTSCRSRISDNRSSHLRDRRSECRIRESITALPQRQRRSAAGNNAESKPSVRHLEELVRCTQLADPSGRPAHPASRSRSRRVVRAARGWSTSHLCAWLAA